jgi:NADP-dependent alcohol dehydrogenase
MHDFSFHNPTRIVFGRKSIPALSRLIPPASRILLLYGKSSIRKNGVYEQVTTAIQGFPYFEFAGVDANPKYEQLLPALDLIRSESIDFILAVGGGSVLDAAKFLAAAIHAPGDPWDILTGAFRVKQAMPIGAVLTLPGTGSEANGNSVISRLNPLSKRAFASQAVFPRFSILDPETTYSLPVHQLANGIADAFTHVAEQYLTYPVGGHLQDRMAEAVFLTLLEQGPKALLSCDYEARANVMWACTLALNTLLSAGVPGDWSSHQIGHELTALHGIDHAQTLAVVLPALLREQKEPKKEKLLQMGARLFGIHEGDPESRVEATIVRIETFYRSLGIGTRFKDYEVNAASTASEVAGRLEAQGMTALGEHGDITPSKVIRILNNAA